MPLLREDPPRVGRYRLLARLGAGGMGVVYLGEADDGQQAAVKVLRPEYADDAESRVRFRREVAVLALVRSRYTVRVLDADPDSDTPFLATEFADGPSLSEYVSSHGPLEPQALEGLAYALAEALAAIHAAGVTHRDLKPSNVLLTSAGPKVIDFGIAQIADASSVTRTGVTIGSPGYMAPEQVTGHGGRRGDIFAWALVVAFAASGLSPFGSGPALAILHRIRDENPDISAVPSRLLPVVTSALAKDPALRPTALELLRELPADSAEGLASRMAVPEMAVPEMAGAVSAAGFPAPDPAFASLTSSPSSAHVGPRRRWRAAAVAAPVVALAVTGGVLMAGTGVRPGNLPSAGPSPRPTVTHSASPHAGTGTGSGAMTGSGAPQGQMADSHAPSGQVVRHKRASDAAASDSATPSASSATTSPSTASPSVTSPSATSSGTGSGSPSPSPGGSSAPPSPSPSTSSDPGGSGSADPTGSG